LGNEGPRSMVLVLVDCEGILSMRHFWVVNGLLTYELDLRWIYMQINNVDEEEQLTL